MTPEKPRPDGEWVLVPREPTPEMLKAARKTQLESKVPQLDRHPPMYMGSRTHTEFREHRYATIDQAKDAQQAECNAEVYHAMLAASPATAALGTPEGEIAARNEHDRHNALDHDSDLVGLMRQAIQDRDVLLQSSASQARTIEALRAALELAKTKLEKFWVMLNADHNGMVPYGGGPTHEHVIEQIARVLKEHPNG